MHFNYEYYLFQFLHYNQRRVNREWRSDKEASFIKEQEEKYTSIAAMHMPDHVLEQAVDLLPCCELQVSYSPFLFSTN